MSDSVRVLRSDDPVAEELIALGWRVSAVSWGARLRLDADVSKRLTQLVDAGRERGVHVEELTSSDVAQVVALEGVTNHDYPQTPAAFRERLTEEDAARLLAEGRAFGIRSNGCLVAVTGTARQDELIETQFTSVHPKHRRQGFATLVKAASVLAWAEAGHSWFGTGGASTNAGSLAMNKAVGYQITQTWHTHVPPPSEGDHTPARGSAPNMTPVLERRSETFRPLTDDDVTSWAELVNHLLIEDQRGTSIRAEDVAHELRAEGFDPRTDSCAAWQEGRMVGWVNVFVPAGLDHQGWARAVLHGGAHACARRDGLGTVLMDAMEARAIDLLAERHPRADRVCLRVDAGLPTSTARTMLQRRGYSDTRVFTEMTRTASSVTVPKQLAGLTLGSLTPGDLEPLRVTHNLAFAGHWGHSPISEAAWHRDWNAPSARLEESTVVLGSGSEPLAYVLATSWADRELYINYVGTLPERRGHGLARLALANSVQKAHTSGDYDLINLTVDSDNTTGATTLYERTGFKRAQQTVLMDKVIADRTHPADSDRRAPRSSKS